MHSFPSLFRHSLHYLIISLFAISTIASAQVRILFDTDMSTDCDDAAALAILHALADNGEAVILATGASTLRTKAPGTIDVINTYYGRPDIPIAATKVPTAPNFYSNYVDYLYDHFPHDTPLTSSVPDAVSTYREVLAAQPDNSVVIVTVGYMTNISELLQSEADVHSPLNGTDLVAAKVKEWACMGGNFWVSSNNVNFSRDTPAAQFAIQNFPKKITFIPREVASVPSPLRAGEELNETPLENPVRISYHKYFGRDTNIDRHCADLATVLYAVRGAQDYWDIESTGSMTNIKSDGTFTWNVNGTQDHNYLVMKGGHGVYSNAEYVEGVLRNLLKQTPHQTKLIIDTDMSTDCNDAGALAVAHALQNKGECSILAVVTNNKDPYAIGAVDAINTWYGRGDIPLGAYKAEIVGQTSAYGEIAQNTTVYGHDVVTDAQVPDAVVTYRTILATQADASVVIASIGWLNNLEALLKSPSDEISPLTGSELIALKVKSISIMGGAYPSGSEHNFTSNGAAASTRYVIENWPASVPIMFLGSESGDSILTGPSLTHTPTNNPVRKAYELIHNGINGHPSGDQCTILHAVRGLDSYWQAEDTGYNDISENGNNTWRSSPDKNQAYALSLMSDPLIAEIVSDLMKEDSLIDPPVAPSITTPPLPSTVKAGQAATFSVVATGIPAPHYQWQKNGVDIPEATAAVYHTSATSEADHGTRYSVKITNALGMVSSTEVRLSVLPEYETFIASYSFDEDTGPFMNEASAGHLLNLTQTGGAKGRDDTGTGGYEALSFPEFGHAFDVLLSGDGSSHSSGSDQGGGALSSTAITQSMLQDDEGAFTYEAFIAVNSTEDEQTILSHDGSSSRGFLFTVLAGKLRFYSGQSSYTTPIPLTGDHQFVPEAWYHVAVTYNGLQGQSNNLSFYWTALNTQPSTAELIGNATLPSDLNGNVSNFLGVGTSTRSPFRYELRGRIDEVRIHSQALAADEFALSPLQSWRLKHFRTSKAVGEAADDQDPDEDGKNNLQEFKAGTLPKDALSVFHIYEAGIQAGQFAFNIPSVHGKSYQVYASPSLLPVAWLPWGSPISGTGEEMKFLIPSDSGFYRVEVIP
ncbi:nucleoside hydrolase [Kiritimatiellota bacterium B12222]|nr:nucleoside hydrolase [Kiritimatiellota bacterium B12222]